MKCLWSLVFLPLLSFCSSAGIEPDWDAAARVSEASSEARFKNFVPHSAQQYRVELRRRSLDNNNHREGSLSLPRGLRASQGTSRQRVSQGAFVVGVAGHPLYLQNAGDVYEVVLGEARGQNMELGIHQKSGPIETLNHLGQKIASEGYTNTTQTRTRVVLGKWSLVSGWNDSEDTAGRSSEWELSQRRANARRGQGHSDRQAFRELEIRVVPLGEF